MFELVVHFIIFWIVLVIDGDWFSFAFFLVGGLLYWGFGLALFFIFVFFKMIKPDSEC